MLATQNPIEQEGTYQLPEAQLDRFLLKEVLDYPSPAEEAEVAEEEAPVAEESPAEADACNAEPVQNLVGELYTPELGEQARVTAGARVERALRPGQIVTMEFRADRLSFTLDEKGRISQVNCG